MNFSTFIPVAAVLSWRVDQNKEELYGLQFVHSKAANKCFPSWDENWTVNDLNDADMSYKVFCNKDIRIQTFCEERRFLAAIQTDGEATLLIPVSPKQKFPM